jgi:hypothetical protein
MRGAPAATMMLLHKRGAPALLLPEFLREVYVGQRTGLLHVTRGEGSGLSFRSVNGEIVSGSSSDERGRLGETMVRRGLLSREGLERALVIVNGQRRRLAPVLRELDLVDTPGLERALALHIREMLFTALLWDEASLLFEDQELPEAPAEDLTLRCATAELILELVRRIPGPGTVRRGLGDLDRPLAAAEGLPYGIDRARLGPAERYLVSRADGAASARTMIESAPLPPEEVERGLLGLLCTGVLRHRGGPARAAPPRPGPETPGPGRGCTSMAPLGALSVRPGRSGPGS